jgi:hypothetical protein
LWDCYPRDSPKLLALDNHWCISDFCLGMNEVLYFISF